MRVAIVGAGKVGTGIAASLRRDDQIDSVDLFGRSRALPEVLDPVVAVDMNVWRADAPFGAADVVVIAMPNDAVLDIAARAVREGRDVVTVTDSLPVARRLFGLHALASERGVRLVVGAGMAPGLGCLLARHAARRFERVDEIHVAKFGTGGPACARQHHRALGRVGLDVRHQGWVRRPGGSGRELCWFPSPVDSADCYRAELADSLILQRAFPKARRIHSRMAATRRDRLTARLPMLRSPHAEGLLGAIRVEVRGLRESGFDTVVLGTSRRPSAAAASVASLTVRALHCGRLGPPGAFGLAERLDTVWALQLLRDDGIKVFTFEGLDGS